MNNHTVTRVYSISNIEWDIDSLDGYYENEPVTQNELELETAKLINEYESLPKEIQDFEVVGYTDWTEAKWINELTNKLTFIYGWSINNLKSYIKINL